MKNLGKVTIRKWGKKWPHMDWNDKMKKKLHKVGTF